MNKEEILEKSRKENQDMDMVEIQVREKGQSKAFVVGIVIAFVFNIFEVFTNQRKSFSTYAVIFAMLATFFYYKYYKFHRTKELFAALLYTAFTVVFIVLHISSLYT